MTEQQAISWLLENRLLVEGNVSFRDQIKEFFEVYNTITGEKKSVTSCGRCISNMKLRLKAELKRIELMNKYPVYRTAKGNLSFKEQGEVVYTIRCNSQLGADEALAQLKAIEKRNKQ